MLNLPAIVNAFGIADDPVIDSFGNGLINHTWKVTSPTGDYILQKVNTQVFHQPEAIAHNHRLMAAYLEEHYPDYLFVSPVASLGGEEMLMTKDGYFRMFPL